MPDVSTPFTSCKTWILAALCPLAACAADADPEGQLTSADQVSVVSSNGITVTDTRWISARTFEADISTPLVGPGAVNGPHRIRVTVPSFYAQNPTARYPVIYLLHGGAGGNSAQWTTGGGAAEQITVGQPVVVVMADGGKVGWFTNWIDQSRGAQQWADFYLDKVIPWVDANFRTVASKEGRAIGGLSMGGYGAMRLAQDRPDLFASAASFSGAVDLGDFGTRLVVTEQALENLLPPYGAFGPPLPGQDDGWKVEDPMNRAPRLAGLQVLLYAGAGIHDADILERTMGQSANRFSQVLASAGVPHFWWMYGRPGPSVPFGCDGGHNFSCWNFAFNDALPRMLSVLEVPSIPPPPVDQDVVADGGFEAGGSWDCTGGCGTDVGAGFERSGASNGWVRSESGWNALEQWVPVAPNRSYTLTAWIRSSANNRDGYLGVRTSAGEILDEQRVEAFADYTPVSVTVNSGEGTSLGVYAGLWANGDTWLQLDDVSMVGN